MKNKSFWTVILIFCLTLCLCNEVFAENYETAGKALEELKLIDAAINYDLNIRRVEVATIISRLLEDEEILQTYQIEYKFTDVPNWGSKYVNFLYRNEIINGKSETLFDSNQNMTPKEFVTILLRLLGYNDKLGEFSFNQSLIKAKEIGILSNIEYNDLNSMKYINRNYVYQTLYKTLLTNLNKVDVTYLQSLYYNSNAITLEKLQAVNNNEIKKIVSKIKSGDLVDKTKKVKDQKTIFDNKVSGIATLYLYTVGDNNFGQGTGFFISNDGKMITNQHVANGWDYGVAALANKIPMYVSGVYSLNEKHDLALLQIEGENFKTQTLAQNVKYRSGEKVYIIGSPKGKLNTISSGYIDRVYSAVTVGEKRISVTAYTEQGSSGSPVFNVYGEVIGVLVGGHTTEKGEYSAFIPIEYINQLSSDKFKKLYEFK